MQLGIHQLRVALLLVVNCYGTRDFLEGFGSPQELPAAVDHDFAHSGNPQHNLNSPKLPEQTHSQDALADPARRDGFILDLNQEPLRVEETADLSSRRGLDGPSKEGSRYSQRPHLEFYPLDDDIAIQSNPAGTVRPSVPLGRDPRPIRNFDINLKRKSSNELPTSSRAKFTFSSHPPIPYNQHEAGPYEIARTTIFESSLLSNSFLPDSVIAHVNPSRPTLYLPGFNIPYINNQLIARERTYYPATLDFHSTLFAVADSSSKQSFIRQEILNLIKILEKEGGPKGKLVMTEAQFLEYHHIVGGRCKHLTFVIPNRKPDRELEDEDTQAQLFLASHNAVWSDRSAWYTHWSKMANFDWDMSDDVIKKLEPHYVTKTQSHAIASTCFVYLLYVEMISVIVPNLTEEGNVGSELASAFKLFEELSSQFRTNQLKDNRSLWRRWMKFHEQLNKKGSGRSAAVWSVLELWMEKSRPQFIHNLRRKQVSIEYTKTFFNRIFVHSVEALTQQIKQSSLRYSDVIMQPPNHSPSGPGTRRVWVGSSGAPSAADEEFRGKLATESNDWTKGKLTGTRSTCLKSPKKPRADLSGTPKPVHPNDVRSLIGTPDDWTDRNDDARKRNLDLNKGTSRG
ncbi:hypothetical protein PGT21_007952 [Puccinia graminis f. sp. tritici]|uniref:Uncharacterized protein n=1 Tax=Puccinia graminis f. sp. tritici TaxID=56615 RepID=A0A5B0LZ88_PUCGR|nr:hypothetical protein PGT21_007952 [Puccinia graminis f. sp. tritici]